MSCSIKVIKLVLIHQLNTNQNTLLKSCVENINWNCL